MIVRIWTAEALSENADDYRHHFYEVLLPRLRAIDGFVDTSVLERVVDSRIEFVIITRWETLDAIRAFAGHDAERAVVEPDAQAALERYDEMVKHYVLVAEERR
ncbi:MAG: antibiotic biosynthesis monooxygenase [Alphaproteobacteria bacterium]|nr:antibiotic biosynthesis monooxygenase [Alphaproteobacteria bacterium]